MSNYWHETDNLALEDDGTLYLKTVTDRDEETGEILDVDYVRLGPIEDADYKVDDSLSQEYEEHLDLWEDSQRGDFRSQVLHDYRCLQGV